MRILLPVVSVVMLLLAACGGRPDGVLSEKKMADVLCDIYKGEAMMDLSFGKFRDDSSRAIVRDAIFRKHGVTAEEFDSTLSYYGHNLDGYIELHEDIIKRLEEESAGIGSAVTSDGNHVGGDSVNVWSGLSRYVLTDKTPRKILQFSFDPDENWEDGDNYTWQFKIYNRSSKAFGGMYIDYEDGTTDIAPITLDKDGWNRLTVSMDSTRHPISIYGYADFRLSPGETVFIDSMSLVRKRLTDNIYRRRFNQRRFRYGSGFTAEDRAVNINTFHPTFSGKIKKEDKIIVTDNDNEDGVSSIGPTR